ncbi:hypothetical protein LARI1_G002682, partial [Lachnellula arida]
MRDVYANSYCNIVATHAINGAMGCFIDRNRDIDISSPIVEIPRTSGLWPLFSSGKYKCHDTSLWHNEVANSPLLKRAWSGSLHREFSKLYHISGDDAESVAESRVLRGAAWKIIVEHFSTCELTPESDRLIAISGLASLLQPLISC